MNIFVDESGHTGADLFEANQPVYTIAALWANPDQEESIVEALDKLHRDQRVPVDEFKGGSLIKSNPGRKMLIEIATMCISLGVEVSFVVQLKPFMAAAVVVEDCADPAYNPAFDNRWTWDSRLKEPLAEQIFRCVPAETLMRWWRSKRSDDRQSFESAHEALVASLGEHEALKDFSERIAGVDLSAIHEPPEDRREPKSTGGYSPNFTTFSHVVQGVDEHARERGLETVRLIHDVQLEYHERYKWVLEVLQNASEAEARLPNATVRLPVRRVASIGFRNSKTHRLLQASDCMAAVARAVVSQARDPLARPAPLVARFQPVLRALYEARSGGAFPWAIGPLGWQPRALAALAGTAGR